MWSISPCRTLRSCAAGRLTRSDVFHPDYVWHALAQVWQAAPDGETCVADELAAAPERLAEMLTTSLTVGVTGT